MALVRCRKHGIPNGKRGNSYSASPHLLIGYPESGLVCGMADCQVSGIVCLTEPEEVKYQEGDRVFCLTGGHAGTKFRLQ
jgi:hypothetical protein